jgi:Fe-S-cluster containining protein
LPLTLSDALAHAQRFPLALVWTTVPRGAKSHGFATRLGLTLKSKMRAAVLIMPTAYIPPSFSCPELSRDGLCAIHENKPSRCKTMPFYPYREESDQSDMLIPRKGWLCSNSPEAAVVYRNRTIIVREDFDLERKALLEQAAVMRQYADYMFKYSPWIVDKLNAQASNQAGSLVTSLSSFLTAIKNLDATKIASQQYPVFKEFALRTADDPGLADYHRNYAGWAKEMAYLANRAAPSFNSL